MRETQSKHHIQWKKAECFFPKIRKKVRMPAFSTSIQQSAGSASQSN